jgi:hypothetical protein
MSRTFLPRVGPCLLQVDTTMAIHFVFVSGGEIETLKLECCDLFPSHCFKFELSDQPNVSLAGQTVVETFRVVLKV